MTAAGLSMTINGGAAPTVGTFGVVNPATADAFAQAAGLQPGTARRGDDRRPDRVSDLEGERQGAAGRPRGDGRRPGSGLRTGSPRC
jgi:hypothetical protein